jgi:hypothetical protein
MAGVVPQMDRGLVEGVPFELPTMTSMPSFCDDGEPWGRESTARSAPLWSRLLVTFPSPRCPDPPASPQSVHWAGPRSRGGGCLHDLCRLRAEARRGQDVNPVSSRGPPARRCREWIRLSPPVCRHSSAWQHIRVRWHPRPGEFRPDEVFIWLKLGNGPCNHRQERCSFVA